MLFVVSVCNFCIKQRPQRHLYLILDHYRTLFFSYSTLIFIFFCRWHALVCTSHVAFTCSFYPFSWLSLRPSPPGSCFVTFLFKRNLTAPPSFLFLHFYLFSLWHNFVQNVFLLFYYLFRVLSNRYRLSHFFWQHSALWSKRSDHFWHFLVV